MARKYLLMLPFLLAGGLVLYVGISAGGVLNPFSYLNLAPIVLAFFLLRKALTSAIPRLCCSIAFSVVVVGLLTTFHLAWLFDWGRTATGSSTGGIAFVVVPFYSVFLGYAALILVWGVALLLQRLDARHRHSPDAPPNRAGQQPCPLTSVGHFAIIKYSPMNMKLKLLLTILLVLQSIALIAETPPLAVEFFPVSEQPVPGGKFINTTKLPKVGYIAAEPSLRVTRLLDVSRGESRSSYVGADRKVIDSTVTPTLTFSLTKDDAATLAELTAKNVGKRILIQIAGSPVLAPNVQEPISGGSFSISFKGEELQRMETLLKKLVEQ